MSIKKYTNFINIDSNIENVGHFIESDDLFIISKNEIEETEFGQSQHDVMEVSVYDINNNLLPQKSGNNVAYIKTTNIQTYLYNITNANGIKEFAIDIEKLLSDLGFTNGILKVNINFVRNKVGTENESTRVWIQEVSPSRQEIRILPLKTKDNNVNIINNNQFKNLQNLNKDFIFYKNAILDSLNSFENNFLSKIDDELVNKFGNDFFITLKTDFGLNNFDNIKSKIFNDLKQSITYYLTNKYYNLEESNFGAASFNRFDDYEVYDFNIITNEIQNILNTAININLQSLKRRDVNIDGLPKEFAIAELQKEIQNNLDSFNTFTEKKRNTYSPDGTSNVFNDVNTGFVEPTYPIKGTFIRKICKGYDQYDVLADGNGGIYEELVQSNSPDCGYTPSYPLPDNNGRGSGGGGNGGGNSGIMQGDPAMAGRYNNSQVDKPLYQNYQK
jgi:hypothetical protein